MQRPGFWDDQEQAAEVSSAHARAQKRLESFRSLESDAADLEELAELAEGDPEIAAGLDSQLSSIEARLAELEEARLFAGEYDSGDAVVTVRSGAGSTGSQDWAEMLRMYLRWAERRGFKVEMKEASEGEEAGIKSATFIARGENAYGLFSAERGVHGLVRISPFDAQKRRHTAFAQLDVAPLVDDEVDVDINEEDLRSTPTARRAPAGSTSTRPTRRCGSRISRAGSWCSARTSAPRRRTRRPRCGCCAHGCSRRRSSGAPRISAAERGEQKAAEWGSQIRSLRCTRRLG